jgi:hypothetical protein
MESREFLTLNPRGILRIVFFSVAALTASLVVQYVYKCFFYKYVMQKVQLSDHVYSQSEYVNRVPDIVPHDFSIAKIDNIKGHEMVSFYYDNGEVWSYYKGDNWLDYKRLTMINKAYWVGKIPVLLSAIIFAIVLIMHISRTGRMIFLSPRFDLHTSLENELLLYSFLLLSSYFIENMR